MWFAEVTATMAAPGCYVRGYGYYGGPPSIGFSFGTRSW